MKHLIYCIYATLFIAVFGATAWAGPKDRAASVSGNWSATSTWGGATVPTSTNNVTINSGVIVTVDVAAAAAIITVNAPTANNGLTISGSNTLAVSGAITMTAPSSGTITSTINVGAGTLSAASITIPGSATAGRFCTVTLSTGTITTTGNITFSGTAAQARLLFSGNGTLTIGGTLSAGGTVTANGGTITMSGSSAVTVPAYTYNNLGLSGTGTKILLTGLTVLGNFTASGGQISLANPNTMSLGGNWNSSSTLSNSDRLILTLNGTGDQTITNSTNPLGIRSLIVNKAGGMATLAQNITLSNTAGNELTVANGTLDLSNLTANRASTGGGTLSVADGATLMICGINTMPANYATYTFGPSSNVDYGGTEQTISGKSYGNLTLRDGPKTLTTGTTVAGMLSINATSVSVGAGINIGVGSLSLGSFNKTNGTWGSSSSAAVNKNDTYFIEAGIVNVTNDTRPTPDFSNLIENSSITFGTSTITLSGTVSASGSVYAVDGETVRVTINGSTQNATISGGAGGFSINFPTASIPVITTPYTITYAFAGGENVKSAANNTSTTLTVTQAPVTVTATSGQTKVYGAADPVFAYTSSDLAASFTGALVRDAGDAVGSYAIGQGNLENNNYAITFVCANFEITQAPVTVTAVTDTKIFDGGVASSAAPTVGTLIGSDEIFTAPMQVFDDCNVGTTHVLTASGLIIHNAGVDVTGNYCITYMPSPATGVISVPSYTWNRTGSTSWTVATNWSPARTLPNAKDILSLSGGGSFTITDVPTQTVGQLILSDSTTVNMQSASVSTFTVNDVLRTTAGCTLNFGSEIVLGGALTTLINNGTIQTSVLTPINANPIPSGKAWGGLVEYNGTGDQTAAGGTYIDMMLSGSGVKTTTGITVDGELTLAGSASASASPTYGEFSSLVYRGSTTQATGAELLETMARPVTIDNSNGVLLNRTTRIDGALTFANGNLVLGESSLMLGGAISGAAAKQCVVTNSTGGVVMHVAELGSAKFPVGPDATHYNPATVTALSGHVADNITVVVSGAPDPQIGNNSGAVQVMWDIAEASSPVTDSKVSIALEWESTQQGESFSAGTGTILHYNSDLSTWEAVGSVIATDPSNIAFSTPSVPLTSFSHYGVANASSMPVELTSFIAYSRKGGIALNWTTATEMNNAGFEIQRKSESSAWKKMGLVDGHGTSNVEHKYSYSDAAVTAGTYTYRLKQIDRDGAFEYSKEMKVIVALRPQDYEVSQNYPNPFNPSTTIHFAVRNEQLATITVFNILGQEVRTLFNEIAHPNTLYTVDFNASQLSSGIYFYRLHTADRNEIKKMMLLK